MHSCPISLEHLYMLVGACEGLSLWSALGGLPNAVKRIDLNAAWDNAKAEILEQKGRKSLDQEFRKFIGSWAAVQRSVWIARILKSIPVLVIMGLLIGYTIYPVCTNTSASTLFYRHWKLICFFIAFFSFFRLGAFVWVWYFFRQFECQYRKWVIFEDIVPKADDYSVLSSL